MTMWLTLLEMHLLPPMDQLCRTQMDQSWCDLATGLPKKQTRVQTGNRQQILIRCFLSDVRNGVFNGKEVWMATDNAVFSLISNKGMSKSKGLCDIVRDIKYECRHHEVFGTFFMCPGKG